MNAEPFQVVVVGAGFGGSLMAMIARRLGFSVALLERGRHPRPVIGESSTPLADLLLAELADEHDLPFLRPFCKWGTWQEAHPEIACGVKRGFTFYQHELGRPFTRDTALRRQLLVAASPDERVADTHWYRADFDHYLVRQAGALGVDYRDGMELREAVETDAGLRLAGRRDGRDFALTADFVIDASGPRGFLHRALRLGEGPMEGFPRTQALFAHFTDVAPLPEAFTEGSPPYPPEQAAVHHVFEGGWVWVLRFNNGVTSAGVAATDALATRWGFAAGESAWRALLRELPSLAGCFGPARPAMPFVWQPRLAFRSAAVAGRHWALLPSAAGVVDPLLSTGFPLTLLGIQRLGRLLPALGRPEFEAGRDDYARRTAREFEAVVRLVGALYGAMHRFARFKVLSRLYFAPAGYSEMARRLGKFPLAPDFLLCGHPRFGPRFRELCAADGADLGERVQAAIEPFDVTGLSDRARDPWYPALATDLLRGAAKLGASEAEVAAMIRRLMGPRPAAAAAAGR